MKIHSSSLSQFFFFVFLSFGFCTLSAVQAQTNCAEVEEITTSACEALLDFFEKTNGTNWVSNDGWNVSNTPCSDWYGVTCLDGKVTELNLRRNKLSGPIPESLFDLTDLSVLQLFGNHLMGDIPDNINRLHNLTHLDLGYNKFTGAIPNNLTELTSLVALHLGINSNLSGSIPENIGSLVNLTNLSINHSRISGSIPQSLGMLTKLTHLALNGNQLTGSIPNNLDNLVDLFSLDFSQNQLTGEIPDTLGSLTNLVSLRLNSNQLTGQIPETLGNLNKAHTLWVSFNQLSGTVPSSLSGLSSLFGPGFIHGLSLRNNRCLIATDPELRTFLESWSPDWQTYNDCPFQALTDCSQVNDIPQAECQALLDVFDATNGIDWAERAGWYSNNTPCIDWHGVTCSAGQVTALRLGFNQLTGSIPDSIGNLTGLHTLNLSFNKLNGAIPESLGSLDELTLLRLDHNQLEGLIPGSLGALGKLTFLRLDKNRLDGEIPAEIGALSNLNTLFLNLNQLSGKVPNTLSNLSNIPEKHFSEHLQLQDNTCLTATEADLLGFLDSKNPAWQRHADCPSNGVQILTPETLATFDTDQVAALDSNEIGLLNARNIAALPPTALQGLRAEQLTQISPLAIPGMTSAQFENLSSEALAGISSSQLAMLSIEVLRSIKPEHIRHLNTETLKQADARTILRLLTNLDADQIQPSDVIPLLPDGWDIDSGSGAFIVPPDTPIVLRAMTPPEDLPPNLKLPLEVPNLSSRFGLGGEGGTTILQSLNQAINTTFAELSAGDFNADIEFTQTAQGILLLTLRLDEYTSRFAFMVEEHLSRQARTDESIVGVNSDINGRYVLTTPEKMQFTLISAPHDPVTLAEQIYPDQLHISENGDVLLSAGSQMHSVLFLESVVEMTTREPGISINNPFNPSAPGRVVLENGNSQEILSYPPKPSIFQSTLLAFSPFIEYVNLNTINGRINVGLEGVDIPLQLKLRNIVQRRELQPSEKIKPAVFLNDDMTLDYIVQVGKAELLSVFSIVAP